MSTDDARGLGEALAEHECLYERRVYPSFECSCGEWDGAQNDDGSDSDGESDNADAWRIHAAAALLASPQFARLIEQREAAARAEGMARVTAYPEEVIEAAKADGRREAREVVERLVDDWADFEHDAVTCPKFDCGDCTMLNVIHDLRAVLAGQGGEGK